jgi:hypothetical protein
MCVDAPPGPASALLGVGCSPVHHHSDDPGKLATGLVDQGLDSRIALRASELKFNASFIPGGQIAGVVDMRLLGRSSRIQCAVKHRRRWAEEMSCTPGDVLAS